MGLAAPKDRGSEQNRKFEALVAQVESARTSADYTRVATPVLNEVDNLEKLLFLFHRTSAAIEVLVFIIARKMVTPGLSGLELLAGVAALAGLVIVRFYFLPGKKKEPVE